MARCVLSPANQRSVKSIWSSTRHRLQVPLNITSKVSNWAQAARSRSTLWNSIRQHPTHSKHYPKTRPHEQVDLPWPEVVAAVAPTNVQYHRDEATTIQISVEEVVGVAVMVEVTMVLEWQEIWQVVASTLVWVVLVETWEIWAASITTSEAEEA